MLDSLKSSLAFQVCMRKAKRSWRAEWRSSASSIVMKFLSDLDILRPSM